MKASQRKPELRLVLQLMQRFLSPCLMTLVRYIQLGSVVWLTKAHLVATPNLKDLGLDAKGTAVQEHFGLPCARHLLG